MLILSLRVPHLAVQPVSDHDSSEIESDTVKCCFLISWILSKLWEHKSLQYLTFTLKPQIKIFRWSEEPEKQTEDDSGMPGLADMDSNSSHTAKFWFRLKTSDQENRTRKPYRNPTMMNDLIFKKHVKTISLESETGGFVGFVHGRPRWHGWQQLAHSEM